MDTFAILKKMPWVDAVYLFGSQVKGTAKPYSDTDICVFASKLTKIQRMNVLRLNDKDIDVLLFRELPLPIQAAVLRDGKQVFVRRSSALRDAKYITIRKYLDFLPTLQRIIGEVLRV